MSLLGKDGFVQLATQNYNNANYLKKELVKNKKIKIFNQNPIFNEFVIGLPISGDEFLDKMSQRGFFAGLKLDTLYDNFQNRVLVSVTEKRTKAQMDSFVSSVKEVLS